MDDVENVPHTVHVGEKDRFPPDIGWIFETEAVVPVDVQSVIIAP